MIYFNILCVETMKKYSVSTAKELKEQKMSKWFVIILAIVLVISIVFLILPGVYVFKDKSAWGVLHLCH